MTNNNQPNAIRNIMNRDRTMEEAYPEQRNGYAQQPSYQEPRYQQEAPPPPKGRPKKGKSSNSKYKQYSIYMEVKAHRELERLMFDDNLDADFSDVMNKLAVDYIEKRRGKPLAEL